MRFRHKAIAAGLSCVLAFGAVAPYAYATPQDDLAAAAARLEELGGELYGIQETLAATTHDLETTEYEIGEKEAEVSSTQAELEDARIVLGDRMRTNYKAGGATLLQVILGSTSIEDFVSRIYYIDKVASNDAAAIELVKTLEQQLGEELEDLADKKASQEEAVASLQSQVGEYEAKVAEAQAYYDSLDAQIQAELAAQAAAEQAAREAAAAEAAQAEQERASAIETVIETVTPQQESQEAATPAAPAEQSTTPAEESSSSQETTPSRETTPTPSPAPAPSSSVGPSGGGVSTAYSCIGKPYIWAAAGPDGFDCSGLVCYCYGWKRGRTTYSMISSLQADGRWKTSMSQLAYGDLVFTHAGHVGIYVGNGMMIHAPTPGRSVCEAPVYAFYGGGTY